LVDAASWSAAGWHRQDVREVKVMVARSRIAAAAALVALGLLLSGCGYNNIPTREEQAKASWAEVQNQYQRRADLIPNLVSTVQGYAKQEQDAQNQLSGALGRLLAVSENYPDLKSNQNFLALQSQLEGTENRIAVARRDYIENVRQFNTTLRTFPDIIWQTLVFHDKPMAEFTATSGAETPPQVKF
jgi:LemA protein